MAEQTKLIALCESSEVNPDLPLHVSAGGAEYAVYNLNGQYYVTQENCTHGPGIMSEGMIMDDEIECPFHQGRFHIPSGQPTFPPCTEPLRTWTVHLIEGKVCIDPDEQRTAP
jgi:nitrite reductase/ring-hydroxylating ferredoxin subunit